MANFAQGKVLIISYLPAVVIASFPYNITIMTYIKHYRAKGAHVIIATVTLQLLADKIADHLTIFVKYN